MAYQALYRRLRPQTFDGVIGQRHITKTLKNQIANGRINHAYLFCGTRGTGKTSTARIFARAINCEHTDGEIPCNSCESCLGILEGRNVNVTELDAASSNGVENIRDINDEVKYPPTSGRYRVYIIDEVHMLTAAAFNALLKTLEEPPEYVVFILATTDPQKIPVTVLSRCQRFDFHRIGIKDMTAVMRDFTKEEGIDADDEALDYIAEVSDGAMRDALGLLDMCMSFYYGEKLTAEKVREITGAVDRSVFFDLTRSIAEGNSTAALDTVEKLVLNGRDIQQFTAEYIKHLRNLLVARSVTGSCAALDYSDGYIEKLREQAETLTPGYLIDLINRFSELQNGMKYSQNPRIMLEVAFISACSPLTDKSTAALDKRLSHVEEQLENGLPMPRVQAPAAECPANVQERKHFDKAVPDDIKTVIANWGVFTDSLGEKEKLAKVLLEKVRPASMGDDDILILVCANRVELSAVSKKTDLTEKLLADFFEKEIKTKPMTAGDYDDAHTAKYGAADADIRVDAEERLGVLGFDIEFREQ